MNVYSVIVTFNASKWIKACLDSIKSSIITSNIIVVDNNSNDDTIEIINNHYSECTLIRNNKNLGFGKANNIGITIALKNKADYIALINQDAKITPSTISTLISNIREFDFGIVAPMFYSYDGAELDEFFVKYLFPYDIKLASDIFMHKQKKIHETAPLPAAMWLLNAIAVKEVGGFDPLYFMYGEDTDLWYRFQKKGWKVGLVPQATVFHYTKKQGNTFTIKERTWYLYADTLNYLKTKNKSILWDFLVLLKLYYFKTISALLQFRKSEFIVVQKTFIKLILYLIRIHRSKKEISNEKSPFLE